MSRDSLNFHTRDGAAYRALADRPARAVREQCADALPGADGQIAASIAEFGFNNPILVDSDAGIVAGHGRLLAARKLGLEEVPVVVLDHLSETQKRATSSPTTNWC